MDSDVPEPVPLKTLSALLREHYAIDATSLSPLPGEYDINAVAATAAGARFVVKLMHSSRVDALLDLQLAMLARVAARAPALAVPRVVRSARGRAVERVAAAPGAPPRLLWVLEWRAGTPLALARPRDAPALLASLGAALGTLARALEGFSHAAADRGDFKWDLARCEWVAPHVGAIAAPARRALVARALRGWRARVAPAAAAGALRRAVVHGDANDWNVLTDAARGAAPAFAALLDFGDAHAGLLVAEVAVAAAYAALGARAPLDAAAALAAGFHARAPLRAAEADALLPALQMRLAVSVVNSALRAALAPGDAYVTVSEAPAWEALERLAAVPLDFGAAAVRDALGLPPPPPAAAALAAALAGAPARAGGALDDADAAAAAHTFGEGDLDDAGAPADDFDWAAAFDGAARAGGGGGGGGAALAIAHFGAVRPPRAPAAGASAADLAAALGAEPAARLLGAALLAPPGARVRAARAARVLAVDAAAGAVALALDGAAAPGAAARAPPGEEDDFDDGDSATAVLLWRGLALAPGVAPGAALAAGAALGAARGDAVTVQALGGARAAALARAALARAPGAPPLWGRARDARAWAALLADPAAAAGLPPAPRAAPPDARATAAARAALLGPSVRLSYRAAPLKATRGEGAFLFDASGAPFLDAYNNVPSVGHAHPRVVRAVSGALARLQTNTRYLHDGILAYAQELTATLPEPLRVAFFVASGSEANDLALRLARAAARAAGRGNAGTMCLAHAYHGHTQSLIDISPYKFDGPGGEGAPPGTIVVPCPDVYRGAHGRGDADAGAKYAAEGPLAALAAGARPAAFIAESLPSVAGQIEFPPGYLAPVYAAVRAAGGVCIADEVQTGFGRLGDDAFWGFLTQGVVPDIVTMGKPIGNGFPMGAVVTTRAIAAAFDSGMEFFCTGGGGPAAAAAGRAVLAVLRDERLPANAAAVGGALLAALRGVAARRAHLVGDVRGRGLFLGIELVRGGAAREPATAETDYVVARLRERGVLAGTEGPHHSVIKVRPPLCFSARDAEAFAAILDEVLGEDGLREGAPEALAEAIGGCG